MNHTKYNIDKQQGDIYFVTTKTNREITNRSVRIVDSEIVEKTKVFALNAALKIAYDNEVDLIEINENNGTSICVLESYDKYKYRISKEEKSKKKQQREAKVSIKEVQLRPVTNINDITIKATKAKKFIEDGDKVKILVKFRGRETSFIDQGRQVISSFLDIIGPHKVDQALSQNGRDLSITIVKE